MPKSVKLDKLRKLSDKLHEYEPEDWIRALDAKDRVIEQMRPVFESALELDNTDEARLKVKNEVKKYLETTGGEKDEEVFSPRDGRRDNCHRFRGRLYGDGLRRQSG